MKSKLINNIRIWPVYCILALLVWGCDDFVEVDSPNSQLNSDAVFENTSTANAAVADLYAQMRENGFLSGKTWGLSHLLGIYSDEMNSYLSSTNDAAAFYTNTLLQSNSLISSRWSYAYNQIYTSNVILEKLEGSSALPQASKDQFRGEALFFRALNHFYLTQLYGDVPYVTGTDYTINNSISRSSSFEVMQGVIADLEQASTLLPDAYVTSDRARANKFAAYALLARVYLYEEMWPEAGNSASAVINEQGTYLPEADLINTFLRGSSSTILQLASAQEGFNTDEGAFFIFVALPPSNVTLRDELLNAFEPGDLRKSAWTGSISDEEGIFYHPNKYRERNPTGTAVEFSIVLRLSEQYLIRAEARVRQGELTAGKEDLDFIRNLAGLEGTAANSQTELLEAIMQERRVELFTEHGHRFFDLKRTGKLDTVLDFKPGWNANDSMWPLPLGELLVNPNLLPQNPGY